MAYAFYDDNGYLGPGPTIQGLEDLHDWSADGLPTLKQFLDDGIFDDTAALAAELQTAESEDQTELGAMHAALYDAASRAVGPLVLSDGEDDDEG